MQRLESHIENLLLNHECVIIPGVGGFVTRYEEPFFSDDKTEIFPPYRSVSFNSQLRENDGLLTQSYMTAYDTNYPKALSLVDKDVRALIDKIDTEGECHIGSIGTLQSTQNRALLFTPDSEGSFYSKELYGLGQCQLAKEDSETEQENVSVAIDNSTTNSASPISVVSVNKENATANTSDIAKAHTHYIIRISKSAVRNTAVTVAAAMLYFIFAIAPSGSPLVSPNVREAAVISTSTKETSKPQPKLKKSDNAPLAKAGKVANTTAPTQQKSVAEANEAQKNTVSSQSASAMTGTSAEESSAVSTKSGIATAKAGEAATKAGEAATKPVATTAKKVSDTKAEAPVKTNTYTLVLASEVTLKGANALVEEMKKAGYNGAQVYRNGKMIRVIYSSYSNDHAAYTALNKLSASSKYFQTAWVMKK